MNNSYGINSKSRILIVGTSGSGKSTLARKISNILSVPDIELDALFWKPNWTQSNKEEFRAKIQESISKSSGFIMHGNYNQVRDLTWGNSDIVIWLDYSKKLVMWRVLKRSVLRILSNEPLWANNKETIRKTFFSKESIILWSWNTYDIRKKLYSEFIEKPEYENIKLLRIKSTKEADKLLQSIII